MNKETPDYNKFVLDPTKDVLVPMSTYVALTNVIQEVEQKHSKRIRTDKYAWYNKVTHERLSDKGRAKMPLDKLQKEYYENIDFEATSKNIRVDRDELGSAAIQLLAEFRGIFKHNVDQGNAIPRPEQAPQTGPQQVTPPVAETPVKSSSKKGKKAGPTLVKNEG